MRNERVVNYFSDVWKHKIGNSFDWNFHFLYLLAHLRHHIISDGVGFRQFMDIAIATQNVDLDWEYVIKETKFLGLYSFMQKVLALNERWFNIATPIQFSLDNIFLEKATQYILENGVFGFANSDNDNSKISQIAINQGKSATMARYSIMLRQLFPPLDIMKRLSFCSYLIRVPVLLPFGWIHRFVYKIFNREARISFYDNVLKKDNVAIERITLLKEWGL